MTTGFFTKSSAVFSLCGKYRYLLTRVWNESLPVVCWLQLNPSTADGETDDHTVRKNLGFAKRWGFGGIQIVNLFAYRATNPKVLATIPFPISEPGAPFKNDKFIVDALRASGGCSVAAWGDGACVDNGRLKQVKSLIRSESLEMVCFGLTQRKNPRHSLYTPYDCNLVRYV
jgi:hypothetical protein